MQLYKKEGALTGCFFLRHPVLDQTQLGHYSTAIANKVLKTDKLEDQLHTVSTRVQRHSLCYCLPVQKDNEPPGGGRLSTSEYGNYVCHKFLKIAGKQSSNQH